MSGRIIPIPLKMRTVHVLLLNIAIIVCYPHLLRLFVYQKIGAIIILTPSHFDGILFVALVAIVIRMRPRPNAEFAYFRSPSVISGNDYVIIGLLNTINTRR